jgi:hypothetical protein
MAGGVKNPMFVEKRIPTIAMKHTYDDEGKRIRTDYFKNGALTRTWKYDCSEEGIEESVNPKKEVVQSSFCVWKEESADGSYITYSRRLNNGRAIFDQGLFNC